MLNSLSMFNPFCKNPAQPQFIRGCDFASVLERLLCDANKFITLVSPYIKLNHRIRNILGTKYREECAITVICRDNCSYPNLSNHVYIRENLHAKCYITEHAFLLGSMNLYDYSQIHNDEFGIFLEKRHFPDTYNNYFIEIQRLMRNYSNKDDSQEFNYCASNKDNSHRAKTKLFILNKRYTNKEIANLLSTNKELKCWINKINERLIVLIWNTSSPYRNRQIGDTIYYIGHNTGGGKTTVNS